MSAMMWVRPVILATVLMSFSARAAPFEFHGDDTTTLIGLGTLDIGGPILDKVSLKFTPYGDGAVEQDYVLTATLKSGRRFTYKFSTGYPYERIYVPMLKFNDWSNIVLVTQEGHGTSASSWYLSILAVTADGINLVYHKTIGSYFGSGEVWMYAVHFYSPRATDTAQVIELGLDHSPLTHNALEDADAIPKDEKLTISWDAKTRQYVETVGWLSDSEADQ